MFILRLWIGIVVLSTSTSCHKAPLPNPATNNPASLGEVHSATCDKESSLTSGQTAPSTAQTAINSAAATLAPPQATTQQPPATPFNESQFVEAKLLPANVQAVMLVHPQRLLNWPPTKYFWDRVLAEELLEKQADSKVWLSPENIARVTFVYDEDWYLDEVEAMIHRRKPRRPEMMKIFSLIGSAAPYKANDSWLNDPKSAIHEGESFLHDAKNAIWQPDHRTVVFGPTDLVRKSIVAKHTGEPGGGTLVPILTLKQDVTFALDMSQHPDMLEKLVSETPALALMKQLRNVSGTFNPTGWPGDPMLHAKATVADSDNATLLKGILQGFFAMIIAEAKQELERGSDSTGTSSALLPILETIETTQQASELTINIPLPKLFEKMITDTITPAMIEVVKNQRFNQQFDQMRKVMVGLMDHHGKHGKYPGAGRSADGKVGLSWRVHLLPFVGENRLHSEFRLDEPWDSPHNKSLIPRMPKLYRAAEVAETGKTSLHVFIGKGSPFFGDQTPTRDAVAAIAAGNSALCMFAGAEQAEFWTKPGGLDGPTNDPARFPGLIPNKKYVIGWWNHSITIMMRAGREK